VSSSIRIYGITGFFYRNGIIHQNQPDRRSGSWKSTINTQRMDIEFVLKDNPSLKHNLEIVIDETYRVARQRVADETGLPESVFPLSCSYTVEQIMAGVTM